MRNSRRGPLVVLSLAGLLAVGVGTAFAANGNCPNGLPFCFTANTPANASEVNQNFAQLKEWFETKTGLVSSAEVTTSKVNTADIALSGGKLVGTNAASNFHIEPSVAGGALYLNWFSGSNGVYIGNGAQAQAARFDSNGNLSVKFVNGRQPVYTVTKNCSGTNSSCTVDCGTGVVKSAWGFHGAAWNTNIGGDWGCGGGRQWLGACIGNATCTVSTGCSTSGIYAECW